jgi:putative membrane protein
MTLVSQGSPPRLNRLWAVSQVLLRFRCSTRRQRINGKRKVKEVFVPMLVLLANQGGRFFGDRGWWFFGGLVPFLLLLGLVGLAVWAILRATSRGSAVFAAPSAGAAVVRPDSALEELRLRYARGEMSREEFLQRSQDLGGFGPAAGESGPSGSA